MSKHWFYADRQGQQQGPVDTLWLQQAIKQGSLDAGCLVWREGMGEWQPAYRMAVELGLGLGVQPPPLPPGQAQPRERVVLQASASSGWLIAIVLIFGGIFVLGILAAIAIPAYADYTARARVAAAMAQAMALRHAVEAHIADQQRCPRNGEGEFKPASAYADQFIAAIDVGAEDDSALACWIHVRLNSRSSDSGEAHYLRLQRDAGGDWQQQTNLPERQLPMALRDQIER